MGTSSSRETVRIVVGVILVMCAFAFMGYMNDGKPLF